MQASRGEAVASGYRETGISEARVIQGTVEMIEGRTWAISLGWYPMFIFALLAYAAAWYVTRARSASAPDLANEAEA